MIPEAKIVHRTPSRLRVRIPTRRGDATYFKQLEKQLASSKKWPALQVNVLTGSILFEEPDLDTEALADFAGSKNLFQLNDGRAPALPLSKRLMVPLDKANQQLTSTTGGFVDLPGCVFMGLLFWGLLEIARGNFRRPPWYTAFWYASGIFTKHLADQIKSSP